MRGFLLLLAVAVHYSSSAAVLDQSGKAVQYAELVDRDSVYKATYHPDEVVTLFVPGDQMPGARMQTQWPQPLPGGGRRLRREAKAPADNILQTPNIGEAPKSASSEPANNCPLPPAWMAARPAPPPMDNQRYFKRIAAKAQRRRRSPDASYVSDPGNWWYDVDSGWPNEVSAALRASNPYAGAQQDQQQLMDQNGAPLFVVGNQNLPRLPPYGHPLPVLPPYGQQLAVLPPYGQPMPMYGYTPPSAPAYAYPTYAAPPLQPYYY